MITQAVEQVLDSFDRLSEAEQKSAAEAILRRTANPDYGAQEDEELVRIAEMMFLELDSREEADENP